MMKPTTVSAYYKQLQIFQSARLKRDYAHLAQEPQYQALGDFFFNEMYGPRDFQARDTQARRLHNFIHYLPSLTMRDIEVSLDLLDLTMHLDQELATVLAKIEAPLPFDEATYDEAYYKANNYSRRREQIDLIRESLTRVSRFTHIPLLGTAFSNTKTLARLWGMRELHQFLHKGYLALREVQDLEPFLYEVETREIERLNRVYGIE